MTCVLRRPTDYAIYSFCQPEKEREGEGEAEAVGAEGDSATNSASPWKKSSRGGGGGMQISLG